MPDSEEYWVPWHSVMKRRVEEAMALALPSIDRLLHRLNKHDLSICAFARINEGPGYVTLMQDSLGDPNNWEYHYDEFARAKSRLSIRTGKDSREVILLHPELLRPGDIKWWGSISRGNLVIGASGLECHEDEASCKILYTFYSMLSETDVANDAPEAYYRI
jgi:hypothetical protein